jgi:hypothetical protein
VALTPRRSVLRQRRAVGAGDDSMGERPSGFTMCSDDCAEHCCWIPEPSASPSAAKIQALDRGLILFKHISKVKPVL